MSREVARIQDGMVEAVALHGYAAATVDQAAASAGLPVECFHRHFRDKEQCYLAAYGKLSDELHETVLEAYRSPGEWPARMRAALERLLDALATRPSSTRACISEVFAAGPRATELRTRALDAYAPMIEDGRAYADPARDVAPGTAIALAAGVHEVLREHLERQPPETLTELLPALTFFCVAPFAVDHDSARRFAFGDAERC